MSSVDHIDGITWHGRKGAIDNAFSYSVDYVALDAEAGGKFPALFSRNRGRFFALYDSDHGGTPKDGQGAAWVRQVLARHDVTFDVGLIELIAQPRILGHVFNPVAFWTVRDEGGVLRVVIPEVTNTYGDRHSYLCHHDDLRAIKPTDTLSARKVFHVSPFQPVEGDYRFRFEFSPERIAVRIDLATGNGGLVATLAGPRKPLTNTAILRAMLRRPLGSRRVLGLIHWQALKLWWKGAEFRHRPAPPVEDVSR